jgi:hypothetical protein
MKEAAEAGRGKTLAILSKALIFFIYTSTAALSLSFPKALFLKPIGPESENF